MPAPGSVGSVEPREHERYVERTPSGGMRGGGSLYSQTGLSGPGMSGYIDLSPDTRIPGLGWLGIVATGIVLGP